MSKRTAFHGRVRRVLLVAGLAFTALAAASASSAPAAPGALNMTLVGNADKEGTVNTDLAFRGNLLYAGNFNGFRILNISGPQPQPIADISCRGPQGDVSVHQMGGKTFLFQSVDVGQTQEDCTSTDAPLVGGRRTGYEGVRVFDVTNPAQPRFLDMIQTACGSHTHTLVPDGQRVFIYVSSYPLGSGITDDAGPGEFRPCSLPHKKISIIKASAPDGAFEFDLREEPLSDDTAVRNDFQACADIQVFIPRHIAVGLCAGDAQIWDISDPFNPTASNGERHTHIQSPSTADQFEFIRSGVVSWDGKKLAVGDGTGDGTTPECDGAVSDDGFYYFYGMVTPGAPAPPLRARYTIPRPQSGEACVSHKGNVIPVRGRDLLSAAYYQGGNTVVDFTDLTNVREVAYSDLEDTTGLADSWATYWYNGRVYANGGLDRRPAPGNRGVDVFSLDLPGLGKAKQWPYSNPQTQEAFQVP